MHVSAVLIVLYLGTEFDENTVRNKLSVGHTRKEIYYANYLTCITFSLSLLLICLLSSGVAGYIFRQMYDRSGFEVLLDTNTYVWIAQLFIVGMAVGYLRDQIKKLKKEHVDEKDFLSLQLHDIQDINTTNVRVKDALETQIVNQNDSVGKIYKITSTLDQYSPEEVLFYAAEMVSNLVKSKDVSIYVVSNSQFARLFSATSDKARTFGNSLRYGELGEMYDVIKNKEVYINRKLDEKYPMMANAIFDDNDKIQIIVMVWTMPQCAY